MKYKWINPYYTVVEGYDLQLGQVLINGEVVQTYPTNDGGYWYIHKGRMIVIDD